MSRKHQRWLKLDNAAKVYPAARSRSWSNVYRLSADLSEPVDREALTRALARVVPRFPYIAARLGNGLFWYYLEPADIPEIQPEVSAPCACMSRAETRRCAMRVRVYENRIALEFFHALTDGTGGITFLKTLLAAYITERYGIPIPATHGVVDLSTLPNRAEREDSFLRHRGKVARPRNDPAAFRIPGKRSPDRPLRLIRGEIPVDELKTAAKSHGVSVTTYLVAALMWSILLVRANDPLCRHSRKPIRILVPANLRNFFASTSLRNFSLFASPSLDPRLGEYTFEEVVRIVHHQLALELTEKELQKRITTNVRTESNPLLRIMPLFIKNWGVRLSYRLKGERASTLTISNLGNITLPDEMTPYVTGLDFALGMQAWLPYSSAAVSYDGKLRISFTRSIDDPVLERVFFPFLRTQGIHTKITAN